MGGVWTIHGDCISTLGLKGWETGELSTLSGQVEQFIRTVLTSAAVPGYDLV